MSETPKHDPDVIPPTPFGPGEDWPATYEIMLGHGHVVSLEALDPDIEFVAYEETIHLHPGPLGFVPEGHYVKGRVVRQYKRKRPR